MSNEMSANAMIYIVSENFGQAQYCAVVNGLHDKQWQFANVPSVLKDMTTGVIWTVGTLSDITLGVLLNTKLKVINKTQYPPCRYDLDTLQNGYLV